MAWLCSNSPMAPHALKVQSCIVLYGHTLSSLSISSPILFPIVVFLPVCSSHSDPLILQTHLAWTMSVHWLFCVLGVLFPQYPHEQRSQLLQIFAHMSLWMYWTVFDILLPSISCALLTTDINRDSLIFTWFRISSLSLWSINFTNSFIIEMNLWLQHRG